MGDVKSGEGLLEVWRSSNPTNMVNAQPVYIRKSVRTVIEVEVVPYSRNSQQFAARPSVNCAVEKAHRAKRRMQL